MFAEKNKSEDIEYFNYPEAKGINIVCFGNNVDIDDQNRTEGLNPDLHTHGQPTLYVFQGNSVGKCNFQQMYYEKNERKNEKRTPQLQFSDDPFLEWTTVWEALWNDGWR